MSVSGPKHYGATITVNYHFDNNPDSDDFVGAIGTGNAGWGTAVSGIGSGNRGKKPMPRLAVVECYSAREGITYEAIVPLPKKEMEKMFDKKFYDTMYWKGQKIIENNYFSIMCGCVPGGEVVFWATNGRDKEEITRAQGKEIARETAVEREAYYNRKSKKEQNWIDTNGIPYGTWDKYEKEFVWHIEGLTDNINSVESFFANLNYTQGEEELYNGEGVRVKNTISWEQLLEKKEFIKKKRGIPFYIELFWFSKTENKSMVATFLLPVEKLKHYFEQGYTGANNKNYYYNRLVFEIKKNRDVIVWIAGDDGTKVEIKKEMGSVNNLDY